jgi:hypothetical protein
MRLYRCHFGNCIITGLLLVFAWLLVACESPYKSRETGNTTPLATPIFMSPMPTEVSGTGLMGRLLSASNSAPLENTAIHLARVFWNQDHTEGVYVLEGARSPSYVTDREGFFAFTNVEPADYVIVVGDVYGHYAVISNPDGTAKIFSIEEGKILDIGQIRVNLP